MLVCFEGPSAIGKTTLSSRFKNDFSIIPEVNQLFTGEDKTEEFWYYKKQVERYQLGSASNKGAILDGDIFQPLWYNWIYDYPSEFHSQEETHTFFFEEIRKRKLRFPDLYIIFTASLQELRRRKEQDKNRTRRNFEKHISLIHPQQRYFQFLQQETKLHVVFLEYEQIELTQEKVQKIFSSIQKNKHNDLETFTKIVHWLRNTYAKR